MLPDIGEKHRHQIDRAEQSDAQAKAECAADRKRPHPQRGEFDHRLHRLQRSGGKKSRGDGAERKQTKAGGGEPAILRGLLQTNFQARQRQRHQRQRNDVEIPDLIQPRPATRQQEWCRDGCDNAGDDVDQKKPGPGIMVRDPAPDDRSDRRRQHGHNAGYRAGDRMGTSGKQQKDAGEYRGDQRPSRKTLKDAEGDERREVTAGGAADRSQREYEDGDHEQPAQCQDPRQPARQGNRDDLGDQIGGLDPAHRVRRYSQRILDGRQRGRDHLDVEDRHEHAEAHQDKAEPGGNLCLGSPPDH